MENQNHHIQKQEVNLDFKTEEKARHWNNRFADFYYQEILPSFSSLLDKAIPDDRSYIIDRLEIDLGSISMDEFQSTFLRKAEEELTHFLKDRDAAGPSSEPKVGTVSENSVVGEDQDSMQGGESDRKKYEKNLQIKDNKDHLLESFYYFLDYGVLPWNSKCDTLKELGADIRKEIGVKKLTSRVDFMKRMRIVYARQRLYFQFSKPFAEEIFNRHYSDKQAELSSLKEELEKQLIRLAKDAPSREKIKQEMSKSIWARIIDAGPADTREWPQYFVRSITENLSSHLKPSGKSSLFKTILDDIPQLSPLAVHFKEIVDKNEVSRKDKGPETPGDKSGVDKRDQKEPPAKSPEDRDKTGDDESSRDAGDDRVQNTSEDKKSESEIDTGDKSAQKLSDSDDEKSGGKVGEEISAGARTEQQNEGDKDLKKSRKAKTERPDADTPAKEKRAEPEADRVHQEGPMKASSEERHDPGDPESSRGSGDGHVQKSSEEKKSEGEIDAEEEPAQKLSDSDEEKSGEKIAEEIAVARAKEDTTVEVEDKKDLKKSRPPDPDRPGSLEPKEIGSWSGSDASKGESIEIRESHQQPGKERLPDSPESEATKDREPAHPEALEEYYLRNAGIILTWPYLARLFEKLEYLEAKAFKKPRVQQRAVHLLGYIGSGKDQREEHELVLAKFLCGWPLQMPIVRELKLAEKEKSSADEMLSSLIGHWSVLKNTSVEGLRQSFFNRDGKLFRENEEEQWRLIVEQESYDMLLDQLPFNIAIIQLPWMKDLLKVDWA